MNYKHYTNSEINKLNSTKLWLNTPINVKEKNTEKSGQTYKLHSTGDCDLDGRKYIALPSNCNHNDPYIKKKYNLM